MNFYTRFTGRIGAQWNWENQKLDLGTFGFDYTRDNGSRAGFEYRFRRDRLDQFDFRYFWPVNDRWHVLTRLKYSLEESDLLEAQASPITSALISMVVAANRGGELSSILDAAVAKGAQSRGQSVAEVRSAVPLTEEQIQRLTAALNKATGKNLTIKTVVDEGVIGGIVTTIDDEVIDGSVRHRVTKLREAF